MFLNHIKSLHLVSAAGLSLAGSLHAQYAPPSPARPFPGFINEYLRAQDPYLAAWDIGANVRTRLEVKDNAGFTYSGQNADFRVGGNGLNNDNNNGYLLTRVMPRVGYSEKWFNVLVEGRASASYDDERGDLRVAADANKPGRALAEDDHDLNLHQGFVVIGNHKEFPVSLKVGRQELVYGEMRLVGHLRWNNNARTFDAAKLRWQTPWFGVDAFTGGLVYNDSRNFNRSHLGEDRFSGLNFNFTQIPGLTSNHVVEAYLLSRNVSAESARIDLDANSNPYAGVSAPFRNPAKQDLYTAGFRLKSKPLAFGAWDYGLELMHQFGNRSTTAPAASSAVVAAANRLRQDAYAAILQGGYTWTESSWQHRLGAVYSYASGDKSASDDKSQTFQNLFATTHAFYGYMDLNSLQNLHDWRLIYTFKPLPTLSVAVEGHLQLLDRTTDSWYNVAGVARAGGTTGAGNGYALNPSYSRSLGQELDVVAGWSFTPSSQLEVGVSRYFRGNYIKQSLASVGSKDAYYTYVQFTMNL